MVPLRSKRGCTQCRARKIKCPEQRPRCATCTRLEKDCSYDVLPIQQPRLRRFGTFEVRLPNAPVRTLPMEIVDTEIERDAIAQMPFLIRDMTVATLDVQFRGMESVFQVMLSDQVVRSSVVACHLVLASAQTRRADLLVPVFWSRALGALRARIGAPALTTGELLASSLAILFLGLAEESQSPAVDMTNDMNVHARALLTLIGKFRELSDGDWSRFSPSLCLLVLEGALSYSGLSLFTSNRELMQPLWDHSQVYLSLLSMTPDIETRIKISPLLAGQYELHQAVYEVLVMFRVSDSAVLLLSRLDELQRRITEIKQCLRATFIRYYPTMTPSQDDIVTVFSMFCTALLVCITALRETSTELISYIDTLTREGSAEFSWVALDNNDIVTWPMHIIALAISDEQVFEDFSAKVEAYKPCLRRGYRQRWEKLFDRIIEVRSRAPSPAEESLRAAYGDVGKPRCLLLLRQKGGVLAREF